MTRVALTGPVAGELSPKLLGRPDLVRYATGARIVENIVIHPTGVWEFREGWALLGAPKSQSSACRLQEFVFSDEQAYVLEFGHLYVRFWKDGGLIVDGGDPVELVTPWTLAQVQELGFTQSADVLFIFHNDVQPHELRRSSHTSWSLVAMAFEDGPYFGQNLFEVYKLKLSSPTATTTITADGFPSGQGPFKATDVGRHVRILDRFTEDDIKKTEWRWLEITAFTSDVSVTAGVKEVAFKNPNIDDIGEADWRLGIYGAEFKWPACATIHEQRLWLAGARAIPDRLDASIIGNYRRFSPDLVGNGGIGIAAATPQVNRIFALAALADIIAFSGGAEIRVSGSSERAAITPTGVSAKPLSAYGSSKVPPVLYGNGVFFVDKQGRRVRGYQFDQDVAAYRATDLTLLADHIPGSPRLGGIKALRFQQNPTGLIWLIRSDGGLAACTYARDENVQAWHRHPAGGDAVCESLAVIPGPVQDEVWAAFRRTVNGNAVRTIERLRFSDFVETPPEERCHLDMSLTIDSKPASSLALSGLSGSVTAVASGNAFVVGDVGRWIFQRYERDRSENNEPMWGWAAAQITAYTSATTVTVALRDDFPFPSTAIAQGDWRLSIASLSGLTPYIGMTATVVGDGKVLGDFAIGGDSLDLGHPCGIVHVGLRYSGRYRTLPLEAGSPPGTLQGRPQRIPRAVLRVIKSIGGRYGTKLSSLERLTPYAADAAPLQPPAALSRDHQLTQGDEWTGMPAQWIIQDQPLPMNVALLVPDLYSPMVQP